MSEKQAAEQLVLEINNTLLRTEPTDPHMYSLWHAKLVALYKEWPVKWCCEAQLETASRLGEFRDGESFEDLGYEPIES